MRNFIVGSVCYSCLATISGTNFSKFAQLADEVASGKEPLYHPLLLGNNIADRTHMIVQRVADGLLCLITCSETILAVIREPVRLEVIVETGDQRSMGEEAVVSTTTRRTASNNFSTRRCVPLHLSVEVSAMVRDKFQRASGEFSEMVLLH